MAITRPVTKTIISTTAFGVPVADTINDHDLLIQKLRTYGVMNPTNGTPIPGTETTIAIPMNASTFRGYGITGNGTGFTVPYAGRYALSCSAQFGGAVGGAYIGVNAYITSITGTLLASAVIGITGYWVTCPVLHVITVPTANAVVMFGVAHNMGSGVSTDGRGSFALRWIGD